MSAMLFKECWNIRCPLLPLTWGDPSGIGFWYLEGSRIRKTEKGEGQSKGQSCYVDVWPSGVSEHRCFLGGCNAWNSMLFLTEHSSEPQAKSKWREKVNCAVWLNEWIWVGPRLEVKKVTARSNLKNGRVYFDPFPLHHTLLTIPWP